jgi:hypothetical protein
MEMGVSRDGRGFSRKDGVKDFFSREGRLKEWKIEEGLKERGKKK